MHTSSVQTPALAQHSVREQGTVVQGVVGKGFLAKKPAGEEQMAAVHAALMEQHSSAVHLAARHGKLVKGFNEVPTAQTVVAVQAALKVQHSVAVQVRAAQGEAGKGLMAVMPVPHKAAVHTAF